MLEQILEILEQPMPSHLTDATRGPYLLRKLAEAAGQSEHREEQLVLIVDGLDEDRGVTVGPDAHSIAALLPFRPSSGLRIVLASRPDPPIPVDVPDNHPLRDPAIARALRKSQWAEVVRSDMQRELKRLLHGTRTEQDLLGLVTAAGGGLSGPDLAELTSLPGYEIEETLHAVVGRTFISRPSPWNATNAPVYVLGHEELQIGATAVLGDSRLQIYRRRLHAWARSYQEQGWPMGTPEYLLRGYFRMLRAIKDIPRLVVYATDLALRDRMLDVTGGDAAALANIADAQAAVVSSPEPNLLAMAQLAIHRTNLLTQNANIPEGLAAVWAIVGYHARADALALAIPDAFSRASTLAAIAKVAAGEGDAERAERILERALAIANGVSNPFWRAEALVTLVEAGAVGDLDRAQSLARLIVDPVSRVRASAILAEAAAGLGDPERTRLLLDEAEDLIPSVINLTSRTRALAALVEAAAGSAIQNG